MLKTGIAKLLSVFSNFGANVFASKFGVSVGQIAAASTPTEIVDAESAFGQIMLWCLDKVVGFLFYLVYLISRFALNFVDFCQILVEKLSGISAGNKNYDINADFEGNPIFRFLLNDTVLKVFVSMLGLGILLVIVFAIIAIIKGEYDSYSNDADNSKGPVIRRACKSLFLFLAMPIFLFIFIIGSNAVLNSANNAFRVDTNATSLGGQVFVSSTYEANRYRNYANRGTRAPMLFDFEDPAETGFASIMTAEQIANAYAGWNGKEVFNSFATGKFDSWKDTLVYKNNKIYNSNKWNGYENVVSTAEEYYVMADFVDWAVTQSLQYYIKTVDDPGIDWEAVKDKIGMNMYYSIVSGNTFSVAYRDAFGIGDRAKTNVGNIEYYIKEYINSTGLASTPIADAVETIERILAVGDYANNTFRVLERVDGYSNYIRWKSEMAKDKDGTLRRVYIITKYTYNTKIEQLQTRDPITVVLKDGVYYNAYKLATTAEIEEANGKYAYICDTSNVGSKVDRVPRDSVLILDDGTEYRDQYGNKVVLPKDKLEVCYKRVSWPEKLYNDLSIVYSDIGIERFIESGTWTNIVKNSDVIGISGQIDIPTAFVSPLGLIMSELFLGEQMEAEEGTSTANLVYSSIYSDEVMAAIAKSVGGEQNYNTLIGQINAFQRIFNNMMAQVLEDAAYQEGVADDDMLDSTSISTYKQYLVSIMLTEEFRNYFGRLSQSILNFNSVLFRMRQNENILASFEEFGNTNSNDLSAEQDIIVEALVHLYNGDASNIQDVLDSIASGNMDVAKEYKNSGDFGEQSVEFKALFYYLIDECPYSVKITYDNETYETTSNSYSVRRADEASFAGQDIKQLIADLEEELRLAKNKYSIISTKGNFEQVKTITEQLLSIQKYLIVTSFRDAVSAITSSSVNITINGKVYNVSLTLSTTEIAELAFGNQLKECFSEFYDSDSKFLYVDPSYGGLIKLEKAHDQYKFKSSFDELNDFVEKLGNISFALNKSNLVSVGADVKDSVIGREFYEMFGNFVVEKILGQFPDIARQIGLVYFENGIFVEIADKTNNNVDIANIRNKIANSAGVYNNNYELTLADWSVSKFAVNGEEISYEITTTWVVDDGQTVRRVPFVFAGADLDNLVRVCRGRKCNCSDAELRVDSALKKSVIEDLVRYWGFEYEESTSGVVFELNQDEDGVFATIEGQRFDVLTYYVLDSDYVNDGHYFRDAITAAQKEQLEQKTLIKYEDDRYFEVENGNVVIDGVSYQTSNTINGKTYTPGTYYVLSAYSSGAGCYLKAFSEAEYAGLSEKSLVKFVNGKYYEVDLFNREMTIGEGGISTGKTFLDYRRDAMNAIVNVVSRPGENDTELADRFLSMLALMCADYQTSGVGENVVTVINSDIYTKSLVKQLAGEKDRPDLGLVGKEYSTQFGSALKDENIGSVFVICTYDQSTERFVPYLVTNKNDSAKEFYSRYVVNPYGSGKVYYPIVAKGIIDKEGNPTVIRQTSDGVIEFYRDDVYVVNASKMGIEAYYQSMEDIKVKGGLISTLVNGVTKLFAGKTLTQMIVEKIPRISADMTLNFAYGSKETVVGSVDRGYVPMSYDFRGLGIEAFYSVADLNIIILLFGTILIVSAIVRAVWGLIQRIFDITVLFVLAPPLISTMPLDKDDVSGKYVTWRDKIIGSVLSVYGIVIGLNAFFIFIPIINSMEFFEVGSKGAEAIMQNGIMKNFGSIEFVNYIFRVIFIFAAIGLIRRAPKLLQPLVSPGNDQDIFDKGEQVQKNVRASVDTVKDHVSGQYAIDKLSGAAATARNMIPGGAIAKNMIQAGGKVKDKVAAKAAYVVARANGVPKDVAKLAEKNLKDSMDKKRKMKDDMRAKKDAAREKREKERENR